MKREREIKKRSNVRRNAPSFAREKERGVIFENGDQSGKPLDETAFFLGGSTIKRFRRLEGGKASEGERVEVIGGEGGEGIKPRKM